MKIILPAALTLALLGGCTFAQTGAPAAPEAAAPEAAAPRNATPKVGDTAPDFTLDDLQGAKVTLSEMSAKGPVVLVMLRGFPGYQCPICTAQVGGLINKAKELEKAGANVLLVYPGPAAGLKERAAEFVAGKGMPANFTLALDPDFSFTNLYNLRWNAKNETAYPSTFVLDKARQVLFAKVSRTHGDRSTPTEILAALPK